MSRKYGRGEFLKLSSLGIWGLAVSGTPNSIVQALENLPQAEEEIPISEGMFPHNEATFALGRILTPEQLEEYKRFVGNNEYVNCVAYPNGKLVVSVSGNSLEFKGLPFYDPNLVISTIIGSVNKSAIMAPAHLLLDPQIRNSILLYSGFDIVPLSDFSTENITQVPQLNVNLEGLLLFSQHLFPSYSTELGWLPTPVTYSFERQQYESSNGTPVKKKEFWEKIRPFLTANETADKNTVMKLVDDYASFLERLANQIFAKELGNQRLFDIEPRNYLEFLVKAEEYLSVYDFDGTGGNLTPLPQFPGEAFSPVGPSYMSSLNKTTGYYQAESVLNDCDGKGIFIIGSLMVGQYYSGRLRELVCQDLIGPYDAGNHFHVFIGDMQSKKAVLLDTTWDATDNEIGNDLNVIGRMMHFIPLPEHIIHIIPSRYIDLAYAKVYEEAAIKDTEKSHNNYLQAVSFYDLFISQTKSALSKKDVEIPDFFLTLEIAQSYFDMGSAFREVEMWESAIDAFSNALKYYITTKQMKGSTLDCSLHIARTHFRLGTVYQRSNDFDKAISYLTKATEVNPPSFVTDAAFYQLGEVYEKKGDIESAIKSYNNVINSPVPSWDKSPARKKLDEILK